MNVAMVILYALMGIDIFCYLLIAGFLLFRAYQTKLWHMLHLAIGLLLVFSAMVVYLLNGGSNMGFHLLRCASIIWISVFIQYAFYRNRSSLFVYFFTSGIISFIGIGVAYYFYARSDQNRAIKWIPDVIFGIYMMAVGAWQYRTGKQEYQKISSLAVAPYIKKRYQLFQWASLGFIFTGLCSALVGFTFYDTWTLIFFIGVSLGNFVYLILNVILWMMPPKLKTKLNQGWQPPESPEDAEDISEAELMAQFLDKSTKGDTT